jgi:hypothetical protein
MTMASQTLTTTDHDEIRQWVEAHNGVPAAVPRYQAQKADGSDSTFFKLTAR